MVQYLMILLASLAHSDCIELSTHMNLYDLRECRLRDALVDYGQLHCEEGGTQCLDPRWP